MKKKLYVILSIAAVALLLVMLLKSHRPFNWMPTFDQKSEDPFDCALFDKVMEQTLALGYEVCPDVPDSLDARQTAVLYCKYSLASDREHMFRQEMERAERLDSLARRGAAVVVATAGCSYTYYNSIPSDSLWEAYGLSEEALTYYCSDGYEALKERVEEMKRSRTDSHRLYWKQDQRSFELPYFVYVNFAIDDSNVEKSMHKLLVSEKGDVYALEHRYPSGGSLTFVTLPLLFTNYAVLDDELSQLTMRLLYPVRDRHLVRIMGSNKNVVAEKHTVSNSDVFSFFREQPPLRWALNITLTSVLLMLLLRSRRRMRAIPLKEEPKNVTLEFARFMGTFHYKKHDFAGIVISQYEMMLHQLNESISGDLTRMPQDKVCDLLTARTQLPAERITQLVQTIDRLRHQDRVRITQKEMMQLLDEIKTIKEKL